MPREEEPDDAFPFLLNTGRLQHQWHTLTKTGRVAQLNKLDTAPFLEIAPEDAEKLGLSEQDAVEIRSRRGTATLPALVSSRVSPGTCFAPFHWNDRFGKELCINAVTSDAIDPVSLQPGIKHCAVSLTRVQTAKPSAQERTMPPDRLARHLGLTEQNTITFSEESRVWISGFLEGLRLNPPEGTLPVVPATAPLSAQQATHLNGLLAGLYSRTMAVEAPHPATTSALASPSASAPALTVWWASQTGRTEALAAEIAAWLQDNGLSVRLAELTECDPSALSGTGLFLVSTFGDGDAPDTAAPFWDALRQHKPPLADLRYAVLALGDSSYASFCGFGRALDEKLASLGASPLLTRVDCEPDYEDAVEAWKGHLLAALGPSASASPPPAPARSAPAQPAPALPMRITRTTPALARLSRATCLTGEDTEKETFHIALDISGTNLTYKTGDALGVWPCNSEATVQQVLNALQLPEQTMLTLRRQGSTPLGDALRRWFDLSRPSPALLERLGRPEGGICRI